MLVQHRCTGCFFEPRTFRFWFVFLFWLLLSIRGLLPTDDSPKFEREIMMAAATKKFQTSTTREVRPVARQLKGTIQHQANCPRCGWESFSYDKPETAELIARNHDLKTCPVEVLTPVVVPAAMKPADAAAEGVAPTAGLRQRRRLVVTHAA